MRLTGSHEGPPNFQGCSPDTMEYGVTHRNYFAGGKDEPVFSANAARQLEEENPLDPKFT